MESTIKLCSKQDAETGLAELESLEPNKRRREKALYGEDPIGFARKNLFEDEYLQQIAQRLLKQMKDRAKRKGIKWSPNTGLPQMAELIMKLYLYLVLNGKEEAHFLNGGPSNAHNVIDDYKCRLDMSDGEMLNLLKEYLDKKQRTGELEHWLWSGL